MKVTASGLEMSIQDLPGRTIGKGIPRSGPMDFIAFSTGNLLVGNKKETEGIEIIVIPGVPASFQFLCPAVVAVTGRSVTIAVDGVEARMWSGVVIPAGKTLQIKAKTEDEGKGGLRTYLSVRGGFPNVPKYLGSKSTSMGLGGYQVRDLRVSYTECTNPRQGQVTHDRRLPHLGNQCIYLYRRHSSHAASRNDTDVPTKLDYIRSPRTPR